MPAFSSSNKQGLQQKLTLYTAHMTEYVLRFFFDQGAGGCLWAGNDKTHAQFGSGPVDATCFDKNGQVSQTASLALSAEAIRLRDRLDFQHSSYLNPLYPPDPSLWTQTVCDGFNTGVDELLAVLQKELEGDFKLIDQQERYAEHPDLADYLTENPELTAIDDIAQLTMR